MSVFNQSPNCCLLVSSRRDAPHTCGFSLTGTALRERASPQTWLFIKGLGTSLLRATGFLSHSRNAMASGPSSHFLPQSLFSAEETGICPCLWAYSFVLFAGRFSPWLHPGTPSPLFWGHHLMSLSQPGLLSPSLMVFFSPSPLSPSLASLVSIIISPP